MTDTKTVIKTLPHGHIGIAHTRVSTYILRYEHNLVTCTMAYSNGTFTKILLQYVPASANWVILEQ